MRLLAVFLLLFMANAGAQGVVSDIVTERDILDLFNRAVAIEIEIPENASWFSLLFGPGGDMFGMASRLDQTPPHLAPTALRVVAFLPDHGEVDPCAADEAEATIIVTPMSDESRGAPSLQDVCVPHPDKSRISGTIQRVFEGEAPELDEWTPLLFHTWLVREGEDERGRIDSAIALESNFVMQIRFISGQDIDLNSESALSLEQFTNLPTVAPWIEEYGLAVP